MDVNFKTELTVNNVSVELNPFVHEFLTRTVIGAVSSLKGVGHVQGLELHLERNDVKIVVNGNEVPLTPFPKEIITNTIIGLVSPLKGIGKVDTMKISIRAE
jgi:hypothetical protein